MVQKIFTSSLSGIDAQSVEVEVVTTENRGLNGPVFIIVGLGDSAVKESKERVRSALYSAYVKVPPYVLVNLAPAEIKKEGSGFDLAIAVGVMCASKAIARTEKIEQISIHGELALDGTIKPIKGVTARALEARLNGRRLLVVPKENLREAKLIYPENVIGVSNLFELKRYLEGDEQALLSQEIPRVRNEEAKEIKYFSDVIGQENTKRAITVAAAGGHNLLMVGPPGCGKSMLAERIPSILPKLNEREMLEVLKIYSSLGYKVEKILEGDRPFRSPHHTISDVGLVGGGTSPRPGEITLAHRGVLFLDEFPEFKRGALEGLRSPLEVGEVTIARARGSNTFPGKIQLIAAMNPCPCGRLGMKEKRCQCTKPQILSYLNKLSEPILDRIDIQVEVTPVPLDLIAKKNKAENRGDTKDRSEDEEIVRNVHRAREVQLERFGKTNSEVSMVELQSDKGGFSAKAGDVVAKLSSKKELTARGFVRVMRASRTIADLDNSKEVKEEHVVEAFSYRTLDRIRSYVSLDGDYGR